MVVIYIPLFVSLFVALVGAFAYGTSSNPKHQQLGLNAFSCGLLAFLLIFGLSPHHLLAP